MGINFKKGLNASQEVTAIYYNNQSVSKVMYNGTEVYPLGSIVPTTAPTEAPTEAPLVPSGPINQVLGSFDTVEKVGNTLYFGGWTCYKPNATSIAKVAGIGFAIRNTSGVVIATHEVTNYGINTSRPDVCEVYGVDSSYCTSIGFYISFNINPQTTGTFTIAAAAKLTAGSPYTDIAGVKTVTINANGSMSVS
jgi:hypothetical protein